MFPFLGVECVFRGGQPDIMGRPGFFESVAVNNNPAFYLAKALDSCKVAASRLNLHCNIPA